jgi:hypothetical protein
MQRFCLPACRKNQILPWIEPAKTPANRKRRNVEIERLPDHGARRR